MVGLTQTFEDEILTENENFTITLDEFSNQITITDLYVQDGLLDVFDQITVILNYSYAPLSSYSELKLLGAFNHTYLADFEESFYSQLEIEFNYVEDSG
ncbi:MAG: hypothetical protein BAJALOKI3v1_910001, partial [Promethearchaeota archaeon]